MAKCVIDCRGLPCPQPVVKTKKAMEASPDGEIEVLLNDDIAFENVSRLAAGRQWAVVDVTRKGSDIHLLLRAENAAIGEPRPSSAAEQDATLVYCVSDRIGSGDDKLGELLMQSFIKSLLDMPPLPKRMIFLNSAVRLATEGSAVLETLQHLEKQGVEIFSCGTCLDFFGLKERLRVGKATNMFDVITSLRTFERVVQP
ncbi:MAG: sulfurtransferase-like selenium metabolism protein YedF [Syntrophotalea acetylenica]|nr:sulfurtransferase-like selenium metabolism protein YedF [Syntrophotalea acetylenica]